MDAEIIQKLKTVFDFAEDVLGNMSEEFKSERKRLSSFTKFCMNEREKQATKKRFVLDSIDSSLHMSEKKKLGEKSESDEECEKSIDAEHSERTFVNTDDNNNKYNLNNLKVLKHPVKPKERNPNETPVTTRAVASSGGMFPMVNQGLNQGIPKKLMDIKNQDKSTSNETIHCCFTALSRPVAKRSKYISFEDITSEYENLDESEEPSVTKKKFSFPWWSKDMHLKVFFNNQRYLNEEVCNTLFLNKSIDVESLRNAFPSADANLLFETSGKYIVK